ncbi:MAG TPA: PEP-CTERM sorting domain-containing protein [Candidatus Aquilonibacter sp.]|nr:PEP-CTERM sorting domain-containing protein [Candidatus Aquilonibacter sp.]
MTRTLGFLALLMAMAMLALPVHADTTITLTSAGSGNVLDNIYTSPYTGTVGGVANTPIFCDDFADDSFINESWSATVSTVANLAGNAKWASEPNAQQNYEIAAWLAEDLLSTTNTTDAEDISYAIWLVLDQTGVQTYLTSTDPDAATLSAAQGWITTAENAIATQNLTPADFANVLVYTPVAGTATNCNGGPCPANSPQEFLVVTPEPGSLLLLLFGLVALAGFARRRRAAAPWAIN